MTDKLPPQVLLTEKQAKFVECIGRGMLSKDAYRMAYDSDVDISSTLRSGNLPAHYPQGAR